LDISLKKQLKFTGADQKEFYAELRSRIDKYFTDKGISKHANAEMIVKTIVMVGGYLGLYLALLLVAPGGFLPWILFIFMGVALAGIGMSVMHDANHGAYSSLPWVNRLVGYSLNLVGGSVFNWKLQHNVLHHTYTNIIHYDDDIADKLVLRMSPHTRVKGLHRYQVVYAFLFYGILTLYWALLKDFVQFARYKRIGVNGQTAAENRVTLARIVGAKLFYFGYSLIIPLLVAQLSAGMWIAGFLLMHFVAGMILTVVFQLAHTVEGTTHPLPSEQGTMENSWAVHQLHTTVDFSRNNKLISYYVGGLNFQIEHHLFPRICHVHYPAIAPIVEQTAREYGLPYLENKGMFEALQSHVRTLQRFGRAEVEFG
jgi:linoleoyl-CoA desaturase